MPMNFRQNRMGAASAEAIARQNAEEASFSAFGQLPQTQSVHSQIKRPPPDSTVKEMMLGQNNAYVIYVEHMFACACKQHI